MRYKTYEVLDGDGEIWFASDDWDEIVAHIEEHEMVRIHPHGEEIFRKRHGLGGYTIKKLSPERFDVTIGRPIPGGHVIERRSAWSRRMGWLGGKASFEELAAPLSGLS